MKRFDTASDHPKLYAWRHERRSIRAFRLDRIQGFITADGEVPSSEAFWLSIGVIAPAFDLADPSPSAVDRPATTPKNVATRADLALRILVRRQLRVLAALGRCDGTYRPAEVECMLQYA